MPKKQIRSEIIASKVTVKEKTELQKLAARNGLTVSDYMQCLIQNAIERGTQINGRTVAE